MSGAAVDLRLSMSTPPMTKPGVLEGELHFRYGDRTQVAGPGTTVFVPAGKAHT